MAPNLSFFQKKTKKLWNIFDWLEVLLFVVTLSGGKMFVALPLKLLFADTKLCTVSVATMLNFA